jgi:pilus assembly protein CpaE
MLGLLPERTLHELLTSPGSLDAEKIAGYATRHGSLDVLVAPLRPEGAEAIVDSRIGELIDAARSGYDAIVIDTAPYFQGPVLEALDRTDELLLVCTPDVPTLKNVRLALQTLDLLSVPAANVRLVLNRANARIGFPASQVASVLEVDVAVELPDDESVAIAVNRCEAVVDMKSQSPFAQAITRLAASFAGVAAPAVARPRRFAIGRRT